MKLFCGQCEKEFVTSRRKKFCSKKCQSSAYSKTRNVMKTCEQCGINFTVMLCAAKIRKFCSQQCSNAHNFKGKQKSLEHGRKISTKLSNRKPVYGKFSCDRCDRYFKSDTSLRAHKAHCGHKKNKMICTNCGKSITGRPEAMSLHEAHCHGFQWTIDALESARISNSIRISKSTPTDIEKNTRRLSIP